jgi:hypothetical protein
LASSKLATAVWAGAVIVTNKITVSQKNDKKKAGATARHCLSKLASPLIELYIFF